MAALTVAARSDKPYDSQRQNSGVTAVTVSGVGTDASEVAAAVASKQHIITGGYISTDGAAAEYLQILSAAGEIARLDLPASATVVLLPKGIYTDNGEALNFKKSGAVAAIFGQVEYVTIPAGEYVGILP